MGLSASAELFRSWVVVIITINYRNLQKRTKN